MPAGEAVVGFSGDDGGSMECVDGDHQKQPVKRPTNRRSDLIDNHGLCARRWTQLAPMDGWAVHEIVNRLFRESFNLLF